MQCIEPGEDTSSDHVFKVTPKLMLYLLLCKSCVPVMLLLLVPLFENNSLKRCTSRMKVSQSKRAAPYYYFDFSLLFSFYLLAHEHIPLLFCILQKRKIQITVLLLLLLLLVVAG
jgi:hypothetical protein